LELVGDAQIVRQAGSRLRLANSTPKTAATKEEWPRMTYNGEYLHVNLDTEQARSHKPVVMTRGDDRFTADQMELDQLAHTIELKGRVRTMLVPAKTYESTSPKPIKP
jgi:lipopolysaccharide export system protein LptC